MGNSIRQRTFKWAKDLKSSKDKRQASKENKAEIIRKMKANGKLKSQPTEGNTVINTIDFKEKYRNLRKENKKLVAKGNGYRSNIHKLRQDTLKFKGQLVNRNKQLNTVKQNLDYTQSILREKDKEIIRLQNLLANRDDEIAMMEKRIASHDNSMFKMEKAKASYITSARLYDRRYEQLKSTLNYYAAEIRRKEKDLQITKDRVDELNQLLASPSDMLQHLLMNFKAYEVDKYEDVRALMALYIMARENHQSESGEHLTLNVNESDREIIYGTLVNEDSRTYFKSIHGQIYNVDHLDLTLLSFETPLAVSIDNEGTLRIVDTLETDRDVEVRGQNKYKKRKKDAISETTSVTLKIGMIGAKSKGYYTSLSRLGYDVYWIDPFEVGVEGVRRFLNKTDIAFMFYDSIPHGILELTEDKEKVIIAKKGYNLRIIRRIIHSKNRVYTQYVTSIAEKTE